jgi:hypothetical protein
MFLETCNVDGIYRIPQGTLRSTNALFSSVSLFPVGLFTI